MSNDDANRYLNTMVAEGTDFIVRNDLKEPAATLGGYTWGFLRAIAECPNCPGVFRVPVAPDWNQLYCRNCGYLWTKTS